MKHSFFSLLLILGILVSCNTSNDQSISKSSGEYKMDRTILPIQPPPHDKVTIMDARDAEKPEPFSIEAPEGAPNVVVVLIDDIGFGATSTFGGAINTPTFDKLGDNGLRFNP
jgi:arylsulfatase